jgi:hypothetical protein
MVWTHEHSILSNHLIVVARISVQLLPSPIWYEASSIAKRDFKIKRLIEG